MLEVPDGLADRLGGPLRYAAQRRLPEADVALPDQVLELATAKGTS